LIKNIEEKSDALKTSGYLDASIASFPAKVSGALDYLNSIVISSKWVYIVINHVIEFTN